ncbi:YcxB family protein [Collimonas pratensis]|uniref:YcxB family protein n=1 Tax=Collimonas pratensis TaxID=279113 RepID=UPI00142F57E1|nr:YcxB family protein [Collimonas pratensis]
MKTTYRISEKEYMQAINLASKSSPRQIGLIFMMVLAATAVLSFLGTGTGLDITFNCLLILTIFGVVIFIYIPHVARKGYRQNKDIQGTLTIELLDNGVEFSSPNTVARVPWDHIVKWRQKGDWIFIYRTSRAFHMLPKSVATNGFDLPLLIGRLTQHVGDPV